MGLEINSWPGKKLKIKLKSAPPGGSKRNKKKCEVVRKQNRGRKKHGGRGKPRQSGRSQIIKSGRGGRGKKKDSKIGRILKKGVPRSLKKKKKGPQKKKAKKKEIAWGFQRDSIGR